MLTGAQMAKRMGFSVVGLPHYTIWHLYEPSVDDIRHMEEMDKEKKEKEAEERARQEAANKLKATFDNPDEQWKVDKSTMQDLAKGEEAGKPAGEEKGENSNESKKEVNVATKGDQKETVKERSVE